MPNPFERLANLHKTSADPIHQDTKFNDRTGNYIVRLSVTHGRWVEGFDQDLAKATEAAVNAWEEDPNGFAHARAVMAQELRNDEGLYQGYEANVAMVLHDHFDGADFKDTDVRNEAAKKILHLVFES